MNQSRGSQLLEEFQPTLDGSELENLRRKKACVFRCSNFGRIPPRRYCPSIDFAGGERKQAGGPFADREGIY